MLLWAKTGIYRNLVNIQLSHKVKNPVERVLIPREGVSICIPWSWGSVVIPDHVRTSYT